MEFHTKARRHREMAAGTPGALVPLCETNWEIVIKTVNGYEK